MKRLPFLNKTSPSLIEKDSKLSSNSLLNMVLNKCESLLTDRHYADLRQANGKV
jgi:hypothetical protein